MSKTFSFSALVSCAFQRNANVIALLRRRKGILAENERSRDIEFHLVIPGMLKQHTHTHTHNAFQDHKNCGLATRPRYVLGGAFVLDSWVREDIEYNDSLFYSSFTISLMQLKEETNKIEGTLDTNIEETKIHLL